MTRRLFGSFGAIALLACLTVALPRNASAQTNRMRVTVPFDFQVSGEAMPAGQYIFESPVNGGMVYLTAPSGARHAAIGMPVGNPSNPKKPQVVFERPRRPLPPLRSLGEWRRRRLRSPEDQV